jgi:nucleotide-binding universal stress UspA family protein
VRELVVGIDGSTPSWRALSMAVGIAARYSARVNACYVWHTPAPVEAAVFAAPMIPVFGEDDASDLGRQVKEELEAAGVEGEFFCLSGEVSQELERLAERRRADIIVVGRSRHAALHLGGVPRRLLAMGHRPVLVVP